MLSRPPTRFLITIAITTSFAISPRSGTDFLNVAINVIAEDLGARILKHCNDYGRIRAVSLELVKFILIDKLWCSECETTIAHFFSDIGWCLDSSGLEKLQSGTSCAQKRKELAVVLRAVLKQIVLFYEGQQAKFGGNLNEFMVNTFEHL
ncbi:hypothetical protein HKX48_006443 [Thoreauomyces humboldtii]|nr:hypothetical protein HKX48_006443 [Thoreauomyces humboldtii]